MKLRVLTPLYLTALLLLLSQAAFSRHHANEEEEDENELSPINDKDVTRMLKELQRYGKQDNQQKQIGHLRQLARELQRQVLSLHHKLDACITEGEITFKEGKGSENEEAKITNITTTRQKRSVQNAPNRPGGATYIRWGRSTCPPESELVYNGVGAGSHYTHSGGGSEYLCMPQDPQWGTTKDGFQSNSFLYGMEYEIQANNPFSLDNTPKLTTIHDQSPRCAVCRTLTRASQVMIPGYRDCPSSWMKEYSGYLMSSHYQHQKSQFVCVDEAPEVMDGGDGDQNGALLYAVEAQCGSLPCPSYISGKEITCVVCSK